MSDAFDRCDGDSLVVIDAARDVARDLGHSWVGPEHVLIALVEHRELLPATVGQLLPDSDALRSSLDPELDDPAPPDTELLATLGVDLDAVRAAVSGTFGPEALVGLAGRRVHQPWQPWRRPSRRCVSTLAGAGYVAPRLKEALEHALADAERRDQATITPAGRPPIGDGGCGTRPVQPRAARPRPTARRGARRHSRVAIGARSSGLHWWPGSAETPRPSGQWRQVASSVEMILRRRRGSWDGVAREVKNRWWAAATSMKARVSLSASTVTRPSSRSASR